MISQTCTSLTTVLGKSNVVVRSHIEESGHIYIVASDHSQQDFKTDTINLMKLLRFETAKSDTTYPVYESSQAKT